MFRYGYCFIVQRLYISFNLFHLNVSVRSANLLLCIIIIIMIEMSMPFIVYSLLIVKMCT